MGCAVSGVQRTMSLFGRQSQGQDVRAKLERKLYIARESPDPEFDLSDCQLKRLPAGIFSICKVFRKDNLYLHNNQLQSLEEGGQLSDLQLVKVFNLSSNKFYRLPNNIRFLVSLTELYLQNNYLESLPEGFKYLEFLKILDVSHNKLKSLNPSLGNLKCLSVFKITGNIDLNRLCPELCFATNLQTIELDGENFIFPPVEVATKTTEDIMKYLCSEMNIKYRPPQVTTELQSQLPNAIHNPFGKQLSLTWEQQETAMIDQENKLHLANQRQREKFLSTLLQEQKDLDDEISKIQENRESERRNLMKTIQKEEKEIECIVRNFLQSERQNPEVIQQQLVYEQLEHDRLLEIARQNYDNVKRSDIIAKMKELLEKDCSINYYKRHYKDNLNNVKQNLLIQESEGELKLEELLNARDEMRTDLVQQLLEDQDVQQAMVSSLLDRVDAKSWSLSQEISLISMHLSRLSIIEQEKKKINMAFNYNEFLQQRMKLVGLLDDLLDQKNLRRKQLINTLKEAESEGNYAHDFWLKSYQKVLDAAPKSLLNVGKLDPLFANHLLQEGVIHCLPFLVKLLISGISLLDINNENLKENGVSFTSDRESILRALKLYVESCSDIMNEPEQITSTEGASLSGVLESKTLEVLKTNETESSVVEGECVVCMDSKSEVVFVPCGHMCCCQPCSQNELETCPMCRINIERKIKVILS